VVCVEDTFLEGVILGYADETLVFYDSVRFFVMLWFLFESFIDFGFDLLSSSSYFIKDFFFISERQSVDVSLYGEACWW
jgi:hypothetical protein